MIGLFLGKVFLPGSWITDIEQYLRFYPYRITNPGSLEAAPGTAILSSFGYVFLHSGWLHLGVNMLLLAYYGSMLIKDHGWPLFCLLFLLGALAGAGAHSASYPAGTTPLVGTSAAIAALLGCLISILVLEKSKKSKKFNPLTSPWILFPLIGLGFALEAYIGTHPNVVSFLNGRISWEGHLSGMTTGMIIGWLYLRNQHLKS